MRRIVLTTALVTAVGVTGLPAATAAPELGPCGVDIVNAPAGESASCSYLAVGFPGTFRLWVYSGRAEATVTCTVGRASLAGPPGAYETRFARAGLCLVTVTSTFSNSWAKAAGI